MLGCELLKGLNVLDLGMNMEILEEQMLREILCTERPELESHWQDLRIRFLDAWEAVKAAEVLGGSGLWAGMSFAAAQVRGWR